MKIPLVLKIENARGEMLNIIQSIQTKYDFSACVLDSILSQILAEIRNQEKIELINANNQIIVELDKQKGGEADDQNNL